MYFNMLHVFLKGKAIDKIASMATKMATISHTYCLGNQYTHTHYLGIVTVGKYEAVLGHIIIHLAYELEIIVSVQGIRQDLDVTCPSFSFLSLSVSSTAFIS